MEKLCIAAPGARTAAITRVGPVIIPSSDRVSCVDQQDAVLTENLVALEASIKKRDRELNALYNALNQQMILFEGRLNSERAQCEEQHKEISQLLHEKLSLGVELVEDQINNRISNAFSDYIQRQSERILSNSGRLTTFVQSTVPGIIEQQSGLLTRKFRSTNEYFDIDNSKIMNREKKILNRFYAHVAKTEQSIADEKNFHLAKHALINEEYIEMIRLDERGYERMMMDVMLKLKDVHDDLKVTVQNRKQHDFVLLDNILAAQEKMQACIIDNFCIEN